MPPLPSTRTTTKVPSTTLPGGSEVRSPSSSSATAGAWAIARSSDAKPPESSDGVSDHDSFMRGNSVGSIARTTTGADRRERRFASARPGSPTLSPRAPPIEPEPALPFQQAMLDRSEAVENYRWTPGIDDSPRPWPPPGAFVPHSANICVDLSTKLPRPIGSAGARAG
jgi:hypothetical protein